MRQNLAWAVGYNAIALPIAAGVFQPAFGLVLRPETTALSVSGSSFLVAVNALLLKRLRLPALTGASSSSNLRSSPRLTFGRRADSGTRSRPTCEETTMMGWYGDGGFGTSWMLMGGVWLLLLLAVGWLAVGVFTRTRTEPVDPTGQTRSALEVLDRRLALGEIDADTYRAQRALLLSGHEVTR